MINPRWLLALAYLLMGLAWLHQGLLAIGNDDAFHLAVPLVQSAGALLALLGALLMPSANALMLHWLGLATTSISGAVLTTFSIQDGTFFWIPHAVQSLGLLAAFTYAVKWWLASGGTKHARKLAAAFILAAVATLTILGLNFIGHGHPYQEVQRPYAAGSDALLALGLLLAAWMGGVAALTLKTPDPIFKQDKSRTRVDEKETR